eukprot:scaffold4280_cov385-Prasinococcus_capsulatus_cf.AAC.11
MASDNALRALQCRNSQSLFLARHTSAVLISDPDGGSCTMMHRRTCARSTLRSSCAPDAACDRERHAHPGYHPLTLPRPPS